MDTQDVAKFCLRSLVLPETSNKTYLLGGSKSWLSSELISVCETLSGQKAEISFIPLFSLGLIKTFNGMTAHPSDLKVLNENNIGVEEYQAMVKSYGTFS